MFLFDSDHIAILQRPSEPDFTHLMARVNREPKKSFFLSIVSFHEQVLGPHAYVNKARKPQGIVRGYELMELILESFRCFPALPFDDAAADVYDSLRTQKIRIGTMDLRLQSRSSALS